VTLRPGGLPGQKAAYFLRLALSLARRRPIPAVGGISVTDVCNLECAFHIPYPGVEHLALSMPQRAALAQEAIDLKRRGRPVLNTYGGLRALGRNDWKRPLDLSVVSDCRTFYSCCRARGNERICRECGYAGWAELAQVFAWDARSVIDVLRRLHRRPKR
jgi:hypothetical protein